MIQELALAAWTSADIVLTLVVSVSSSICFLSLYSLINLLAPSQPTPFYGSSSTASVVCPSSWLPPSVTSCLCLPCHYIHTIWINSHWERWKHTKRDCKNNFNLQAEMATRTWKPIRLAQQWQNVHNPWVRWAKGPSLITTPKQLIYRLPCGQLSIRYTPACLWPRSADQEWSRSFKCQSSYQSVNKG